MRTATIAALIVIAGTVSSFAQGGEPELNLNNYTDSVSYLVGMQIVQNLQKDNVRVNIDILAAGVEDVLNRVEARLTPTQRMNVLLDLQARGMELEKSEDEMPPEKFAEKLYGKVSSNPPTKIKSSNDSISYCIGFNIGQEILGERLGVNTFAVVTAIRMVSRNKPLMLSETDVLILRMRLQSEGDVGVEPDKFARNAEDGKAFLKQNQMREGVVTLPSGLQYEVLNQGTGEKPTIHDEVTVHYKGMLINGDVFDSSFERGEPVTFFLGDVIKGWTEALQLMAEGSKWRLFVPANLAYGSKGAGDKVPPNTTLVFEIELISIVR